jgi:predicted kinase
MTRKRMTTLRVYRGLPGSGKTTLAKKWVAADPARRARVNRDDLRAQLHDGTFIKGETEGVILAARDAMIGTLLKRGISVTCDDTNLPRRTLRDLKKTGDKHGAAFELVDLTDVPVETCILRDTWRQPSMFGRPPGKVGEAVIRDMYERYIKGKQPVTIDDLSEAENTNEYLPYTGTPGKPPAVIVDIDGTVALKGTRNPFDETRVHEDKPNKPVIILVELLAAQEYEIVFCSGRTNGCYEATQEWLWKNIRLYDYPLHMRKAGDSRKDSIVKYEIFNDHIRNNYDVKYVLDDRRQVIDMYRKLGLTVMDVAGNEF